MKSTLYEILEVGPGASAADVCAAYARRRESSRGPCCTDPNLPCLARQAFDILSNPGRRATYDASPARGTSHGGTKRRISGLHVILGLFIAAILLAGFAFRWPVQPMPAYVAPDVTSTHLAVAGVAPSPLVPVGTRNMIPRVRWIQVRASPWYSRTV
jgi:hypothetical protein